MEINYADAVLQLRTHLHMSQKQFAKHIGASFASVNRWENGVHEPTKIMKARIRQMLSYHGLPNA